MMNTIALLALLCLPVTVFAQCPDCCNGVMDCSETGIDCGGPDCMPCSSLVPNGSFECTPHCFVTGTGQIQSATRWDYGHATEAPDYFNSCFIFDANIQTPANFRGNQAPHTGNAYAGFLAQNDQFSDPRAGYLQIQLTSPLVAGEDYTLSYWVSLADNYGMAMGGLGCYFSEGAISPPDNAPLSGAQLESDYFTHITDATNWTQITGVYTAAGGEDYIVLGNFKTTFSPPHPFVTYSCCGSSLSYYYIDDVSLRLTSTLPVSYSAFTAKAEGNKVRLNWTTASEQNSDRFYIERRNALGEFKAIGDLPAAVNSTQAIAYEWYDNHPENGANYYRVKEVDKDGKQYLTNIVTVEMNAILTVGQVYFSADESLLNYQITLGRSDEFQAIGIELLDQTGRLLKQESVEGSGQHFSGKFQTGALKPGIYFVRFSTATNAVTQKFVVIR